MEAVSVQCLQLTWLSVQQHYCSTKCFVVTAEIDLLHYPCFPLNIQIIVCCVLSLYVLFACRQFLPNSILDIIIIRRCVQRSVCEGGPYVVMHCTSMLHAFKWCKFQILLSLMQCFYNLNTQYLVILFLVLIFPGILLGEQGSQDA